MEVPGEEPVGAFDNTDPGSGEARDDRLGEEVGVAIVLKDGADLQADEVRSHCLERLAKHKVPRYIWFMADKLPRNANGKFLKRELRDTLDIGEAV